MYSTAYSYSQISDQELNIKWLDHEGNLFERNVAYDTDSLGLTIGAA
jgi:hypothetical protein